MGRNLYSWAATINEVFVVKTDIVPNNNWVFQAVPVEDMDGSFFDSICVTGGATPQPLPPHNPLSTKQIDEAQQYWYSGSLINLGMGCHIQTNDLYRWLDHGEHKNIKSPVNL